MPLASKDISWILNLLNEDTCGSTLTLGQIEQQFQENISKSDYLRFGNALLLLLQNRDLTPTAHQRLIVFFLFIVMYQTEENSIETNPFAPIFLSILENNAQTSSKHYHWKIPLVTFEERAFVTFLLNNRIKELLNRTPNQILQSINTEEIHRTKNEFNEKLKERKQQIPIRVQCHLPAVINDPEINSFGFDTLISGSRSFSSEGRQTSERLLMSNAMEQTIRPEYLRLVPPLHECTIDEFVWLSPIDDHDEFRSLFSWDLSMCTTKNVQEEVRLLMERAYQGVLNLQQQQKLMDELNRQPDLISHVGLTPSKLPLLVENCPSIGIQCLLKLISNNQMNDYLTVLANMEMSVHSMEVVNRLSTSIELPQEFLHLYISTCIKTCEQTKDRFLQGRFVRLVSVFIQSLIRNKVIDIKDLYVEVQGFCIHFSNIKEAGVLYQLLQTFTLHSDQIDDTSTTASVN